MGRSRAIPFTVEIKVPGFIYTPCEWRLRKSPQEQVPGDGQPTADNLRKYVAAFEESTRTGGNKHLGPTTVSAARIVRQSDKAVMAEYTRPLFTVG
jgi:hypothetical protein